MTLSKILGLSFGHGDSSAALVVEGKLIAAAEEERFNRIKHYALYPTEAVRYCLDAAGLRASDIDAIAIARKPMNQLLRRVQLVARYPEVLAWPFQSKKSSPRKNFSDWLKEMDLGKASIKRCEHHLAHMYSARYLSASPEMAFLSFDGLGDFVSTAYGQTTEKGIRILDRVTFPHSLGFFYTAMTQYLGFPYFGDEFKVMGLSSYGEPKFLPVLRRLIREVDPWGFKLNLEAFPILRNPRSFYVENGQPYVKPLYNSQFMTSLLGIGPRKPKEPLTHVHWDLAKSIQARFEEVATHLLRYVDTKASCKSIGLVGGCAHNSVWVGKVRAQTSFDEIIVAPASHDAGIAVGAAMALVTNPSPIDQHSHSALLGPAPLRATGSTGRGSYEEKFFKTEKALIDFMVEALSGGKIIGLCKGRMEFGPRALGSRSILADPRSSEMKEKLNARVKHRENFRPFAASVLEEQQHDWFIDPFYAPTMEAVFPVKESAKKKIPAVVHADGSCRIQSVRRSQQPFYWGLIDAFRKKTGVPMLINTSFNDSEPIVCTEDDAIRCFLNTDLDLLVLEDRILLKPSAALAKTG